MMMSRSPRPGGRRRQTARCSPTANKHLMGQLWCRGPTNFHRLQNPAHLRLHILHSPPGVSLDAVGGSPSPAVAMESVDKNRNNLVLVASASLPAPSEYSDVWMEAMSLEFDGLVAAGTFAKVTEIPEECNIVDTKWLYRWKRDSHDMVDRAKARTVAMGYSQVWGVNYFEMFAPTTSAT